MKLPNFYKIVYEGMITFGFELPNLLNHLQADVERRYDIQLSATWGEMRKQHPWYAEIIAEVEDFIEANFHEAGLGLGHTYYLFPHLNAKSPPIYWQECKVDFRVIVEMEDEKDIEVYHSVDSLLKVEFNQPGYLKSIEVEEELTGAKFQIWPELEYSADEPIYIDKKMAAAEGLL